MREKLNFTLDDLEDNRGGRLSETQRALLRKSIAAEKDRSSVGGMLFGLFVGGVVMLLVGLPARLLGALDARKRQRDAEANEVRQISGRIRLDMKDKLYTLTVIEPEQETTFMISKEQFLAFKNGEPYTLYYLPHSRMILAAEWLNAEEAEA